MAADLADRTPALLSSEGAAPETFETDDNGATNSLGTFLQIEMIKFNKLLRKITASLSELQRAIKGTVVMSKELDSMFQALLLQRVPDMWAKVSSSPNPRPSTFNAPPAARARYVVNGLLPLRHQ